MQKCSLITVLSLSVLMLAGCTTTYTMTTRTGEIIETQGKPEVDTATGMTKYADAYGYHRVIKTSEIVQTTEGASKLDWLCAKAVGRPCPVWVPDCFCA